MWKWVLYVLYGRSTVSKAKRLTTEGGVIIIALVVLLQVRVIPFHSQLLIGLLGLLVVSFILSRFFRPHLQITRNLSQFGTVGVPLEYRIILKNPSSKPQNGLYLVENIDGGRLTFKEFARTPSPEEQAGGVIALFSRLGLRRRRQWLSLMKQGAYIQEYPVPSLPPQGEVEIRAEMLPIRRGEIMLTGLTFARPDPFHLFRALHRVPLYHSVLILPKRYAIPPIRLPGTRKFKLGGMALASSVGDSQEFMSLREYRPGDPLRRIHWRSWAKTGKPVVKEFHDEYFVRHALVLDTFHAAAYGDLFEEAVSVAASLASNIRTQDSLLDLMFVGPEAYCFTVGRGLGQTEQMLKVLASVTPCQDKDFSTLPPLVFEHASLLSGAICILLAWDDERQRFIQGLRRLGVPVLALVVTDGVGKQPLAPGPMSDKPGHFHVLEVGNIQEGLTKITM